MMYWKFEPIFMNRCFHIQWKALMSNLLTMDFSSQNVHLEMPHIEQKWNGDPLESSKGTS